MNHPRPSAARGRRIRGGLLTLALAATSWAGVGCGSYQLAKNSYLYNSGWNDFVAGHRNSGMATKAWHRHKHAFCNEQCLDHFCEGFRAGYLAVAEGSDGCTPPFPPREYWGWEYQNAEGQRQVSSWFSGYPHGVRAAEMDGIGNFAQIQTSYTINNNMSRAGLLGPNQRPGMYPMPATISPTEAYASEHPEMCAAPCSPPPGQSVLTPPAPIAPGDVGPHGVYPVLPAPGVEAIHPYAAPQFPPVVNPAADASASNMRSADRAAADLRSSALPRNDQATR